MSLSNGSRPIDQRIFSDLHEQSGVGGMCLQAAGRVLTHNLPYSDDRVGDLAAHVERLCASYENVGRGIWQILAGFDTQWLLILSHVSLRLSILLVPNTDPSPISSRGTRLLMEIAPHILVPETPAEPVPELSGASHLEAWTRQDFEQKLTALLSRVAGQDTARKIIQRELARAGRAASDVLPPDELQSIGLAVLNAIPNRGKRQALISEFIALFKP